jgi:hypothetical protein
MGLRFRILIHYDVSSPMDSSVELILRTTLSYLGRDEDPGGLEEAMEQLGFE